MGTPIAPTVARRPRNWIWAALPIVLLAVGFFVAPALAPQGRAWTFVLAMGVLAAEFVVIGQLVNGRISGAFIDNRNLLSLSKLQAGAWTVVVLAAFATAAAYNVAAGKVDYSLLNVLRVQIPSELLLAMGISATSLVAAPSLLSIKSNEQPVEHAALGAANRTGRPVVPNGKLLTRPGPEDAAWEDLVTGEELGNAGTPDLAKIQQGLITLILLGAYAGYVFQFFATTPGAVTALPTIDKSFVWLMGISHASYLANKAAPHSSSKPDPAR